MVGKCWLFLDRPLALIESKLVFSVSLELG